MWESIWSLGSTSIDRDRPYEPRLYVRFASSATWKNPFLKSLVTGDETWILYQNVHRKRTWSKENRPSTVAKPGLHPKKVLLCIWWDWKGVVNYELLPQGEMINADKYCYQFDQSKAAMAEKRPELANWREVVFHHDNARPHIELVVKQKLLQFVLGVLPQSPYSPDLAPSDYYLLHLLKKFSLW